MKDKRCKYKVRERLEIYLYIKYPKSHIYYAKFPKYNKTISTGCLNAKDAYVKAWELYETVKQPEKLLLFKPFNEKKRDRDLRFVLSYLPDNLTILTETTIKKLQKDLKARGISGKSVNAYIYILRRAYTGKFPYFETLEYTTTYRACFPIKAFYHFWQKCNSRLHYLAFFTMTTGCRLSEIPTCENLGNGYLKINGTKTKNAVRVIPVLDETIACIEYLQNGFRASSYKESVIEAGKLCGFDEKYIEDNQIKFHSFRKMYKTLLESCEIPNSFIEYYMGHSQTSNVNQLYFIGSSADDSEVYPKVIDALKRYL